MAGEAHGAERGLAGTTTTTEVKMRISFTPSREDAVRREPLASARATPGGSPASPPPNPPASTPTSPSAEIEPGEPSVAGTFQALTHRFSDPSDQAFVLFAELARANEQDLGAVVEQVRLNTHRKKVMREILGKLAAFAATNGNQHPELGHDQPRLDILAIIDKEPWIRETPFFRELTNFRTWSKEGFDAVNTAAKNVADDLGDVGLTLQTDLQQIAGRTNRAWELGSTLLKKLDEPKSAIIRNIA